MLKPSEYLRKIKPFDLLYRWCMQHSLIHSIILTIVAFVYLMLVIYNTSLIITTPVLFLVSISFLIEGCVYENKSSFLCISYYSVGFLNLLFAILNIIKLFVI